MDMAVGKCSVAEPRAADGCDLESRLWPDRPRKRSRAKLKLVDRVDTHWHLDQGVLQQAGVGASDPTNIELPTRLHWRAERAVLTAGAPDNTQLCKMAVRRSSGGGLEVDFLFHNSATLGNGRGRKRQRISEKIWVAHSSDRGAHFEVYRKRIAPPCPEAPHQKPEYLSARAFEGLWLTPAKLLEQLLGSARPGSAGEVELCILDHKPQFVVRTPAGRNVVAVGHYGYGYPAASGSRLRPPTQNERQRFKMALSAIGRVAFGIPQGGADWAGQINGTAFVVDPSGTLVTNFHNIWDVLCLKGLIRSRRVLGVEVYFVAPEALSEGIVLESGHPADTPAFAWSKARVLALGAKGWISESEEEELREKDPERYRQLVAMGYGGVNDVGDFVVMQPLDLRPGPPVPCLDLRETKLRAGEQVWSFGYPSYTPERSGSSGSKSAIDYQLAASRGRVLKGLAETVSYPTLLELFAGRAELAERGYGNPDLVRSSVDTGPGSSGGPLLDSDGKVVAVTVASANVYGYSPGESEAIGVGVIRPVLQAALDALGRSRGEPC